MAAPRERRLNAPDDPVLLLERETASGHRVAVARLNSEQTLNSLTLDMIRLLTPQLERWAEDDGVVMVQLEGAGDRALAAGGDIQALYHAMVENHAAGEVVNDYPETFFAEEYRLDHLLHTYDKPVLAWGNGIIMGGGLGLFAASSRRVVTATARIALPEITIGLFPDAGGTALLKRLPVHLAHFIGLTGCHLNAADALHTGLGRYFIHHERKGEVEAALGEALWLGNSGDREVLHEILSGFIADEGVPEGQLAANEADIERLLAAPGDAVAALAALEELGERSAWLGKQAATAARGCPTTFGIVLEQVARAREGDLTLAECFQLELTVASHCARNRDFAEGVRALLIDKDNRPAWQYATVADLPDGWVASHFEPPWAEHPLADLGT